MLSTGVSEYRRGIRASANPFLCEKVRPLVIGHRGVPALHQENSLAGFDAASRLGIDGAELDVRLTADGVAVVCHDDDLARLTGRGLRVSESSWDQIRQLEVLKRLPMGTDASGAQVVIDYDQKQFIPRLEQVFETVGTQLLLNIELKLDTRPWWSTRISMVVAHLIARFGLGDRVIVTSFDIRKLRAAKREQGELTTGFCFDDSMLDGIGLMKRGGRRRRRWLAALVESNVVGRLIGGEVLGVDHSLIGERTVALLRRRHGAVGTHTLFPVGSTTGKPIAASASTEEEVHRLARLGVDWIESDDPERLSNVLR